MGRRNEDRELTFSHGIAIQRFIRCATPLAHVTSAVASDALPR
jgi:hypothetical protein